MASSRARIVFAAALIAIGFGWMSGAAQRGQPPPNPGAPTAATGTAFIAGQVIESPSGHPVAGASVSIAGGLIGRAGQAPRPVIVDSQGRFFFADLPAGTYRLIITKPGYTIASQASQARLVNALADGERLVDVHARLVKLGTLSGVVRDDAGDAVVGTGVYAIRRALVNGQPTLRSAGQSTTDDRGGYHFADLTPGDYFVCACSRDSIPFDGILLTTLASEPMSLMSVAARALKSGADVASLDATLRTFAPTFYPASSTVARATRVIVAPGEDTSGVDIIVTPVRATRVSGTIVGATGPVTAQSIRLVPAGETEEAAAMAQIAPVLVQPDGRFDFAGVPPGQYVLRVNHFVLNGQGGPTGAAMAFIGARGADVAAFGSQLAEPRQIGAEPVVVGDDGVTGLTVALRRTASIKGRVEFTGAPAPAPQMLGRGTVVIGPLTPDPARASLSGLGRLTPEGTFDVRGLSAGRYSLEFTSVPGWAGSGPTSVLLGGVDVTDLPISVEGADLSDLVITFSDKPMATLAGALAGDARDDVSVLIFPSDRRYWADPAAAARRFKASPVKRNGTFTVPGLPAGEYFVVVVPDEAASEWQDASRLDAFSRTGQRVRLADGDRATLSVKR